MLPVNLMPAALFLGWTNKGHLNCFLNGIKALHCLIIAYLTPFLIYLTQY